VTLSGVGASATNPVPPGSVVVVTRVGLGKVGLTKQELCFSQDCQALLFDPELLDPSFVAHQTRRIVRGIRGRGTTIAGVTVKQLRDLPFTLAPLPEQHRIVDALDSYPTRLDDAVAGLERVQAKLKAYRASVLKAAAEGCLVPTEASLARAERRAYEPAEVLLARILKERRRRWEEAELAKLKAAGKTPKDDKWKAKYGEPVAPDTSTLPELPEGWCWASADALTEAQRSITYGVVKLGDTTEGGVPTLRSSNVRHLWLDCDYVKPISPQIANQYRRTVLEGGEVLVTVRGTLGGVAVVPHSARGWNISREVAILALVAPELGGLVADFIASPILQGWMMRRTRGNTYTGINIESLKQLPIPIPPLAETERIVERVEAILSVAAASRETVVRDIRRASRLRQSIVKWAFDGRLVDQDPNDEPAERLLARIRSDRAAVPTSKKTRGRAAKGAA